MGAVGEAILNYLAHNPESCFLLSEVNRANLEQLETVQNIVVVGSSCVGKTTKVAHLRDVFQGSSKVKVAQRYITRPQRLNDDVIENKFVTAEEFDEHIAQGIINFSWSRKMEGTRVERYGFSIIQNKLTVLSGNNALYANRESIAPAGILEKDTLWIGVYAPDVVRIDRMMRRSPDLSEEEMRYRLGDSGELVKPEVHLILRNYDYEMKRSSKDFEDLVNVILEAKKES